MRTKIVYVVVSNVNDYYFEQFLISICSLRKHNPYAYIEIVCDKDTKDSFKGNRQIIFEYATKITSVNVPVDWNNFKRSRFIKTNLRTFINGDYLFVDTDTIICSPMDFIDSFTFDIGAVYDCHIDRRIPSKHQKESESWVCAIAKNTGIDITGTVYFNSGVLYVKDTQIAHLLYKKWFELYNDYQSKGTIIDQLSLAVANKELGEVITVMNPSLNCQSVMKEAVSILPKANIIHYFTQQRKYSICYPCMLNSIKKTGEIPSFIKDIIDEPYDYFKEHSAIISGPSVNFVKSPLLETYIRSPKLFMVFIYISKKYHHLKDLIRRLIF